MTSFLMNIAISFWAFFCCFMCGLGFSLILLPSYQRSSAIFLAPAMGISLLILIGVFQISVLLVPITPAVTILFLFLSSLVICFGFKFVDFQKVLRGLIRTKEIILFVFPFFLILVFAWLFHSEGIHLILGGSDQLQYCQDARHIFNEMHTGSLQDSPIPRQDFFIYDMCTRILPYLKGYRRGAEVLLVNIHRMTQLNFEETFPVTVLVLLMSLGLSLGYFGKRILYFNFSSILLLQVAFLTSFHFLLLHIQGSLAVITSLTIFFLTLGFVYKVGRSFNFKKFLLGTIFVASYLSIYSEPAVINIIIPSLLVVLIQMRQSLKKGLKAIKNITLMYLLVAMIAPYAIYSLVINFYGNTHKATNLGVIPSYSSNNLISILKQWELADVVFGIYSYFDLSSVNAKIALFTVTHFIFIVFCFFIFSLFAMVVFLRSKNPLGWIFGFILLSWMFVNLVFGYQQNSLYFARSLHYLFSFLVLGFVLLASQSKLIRIREAVVSRIWLGRLLIFIFIMVNSYTSLRTINYLVSHNNDNDPYLTRFNETMPSWKILKNELSISALKNKPVLISGFKDTVKPFAIAINIRDQPHVVGYSILKFWPIITTTYPVQKNWCDFNTKLSQNQYRELWKTQMQKWPVLLPKLINNSEQAVVPVGNGFPTEWKCGDIFPPRIKRIPNLCDIFYRNEFAVILNKAKMSSLQHDKEGLFRELYDSTSVIVKENPLVPYQFKLTYEGSQNNIKVKIGKNIYQGKVIAKNKFTIQTIIKPEDVKNLMLVVNHKTKIRSILWEPL